MVSLLALWMPIVLAAVVVFFVSSFLHMVLTYHRADYKQLPGEGAKLDLLRGLAPGLYHFPYCADQKEMQSPEMTKKLEQGPIGQLVILPTGQMKLGKFLGQWFVFCLVVCVFAAYLASRTLPAGTDYLMVFRVVGAAAFMGFGLGQVVDSIWRGVPWSNTARAVADALVYSLLAGGVFGWLWPR